MAKPRSYLTFVLAAGLLAPAASWAQLAGRSQPAAAALRRRVQAVADYASTTSPTLDIDSLAHGVAREVAAYLKQHELSAAEAERLGLELSAELPAAAHLRVYTFGYTAGGTRGGVSVPVLQWKTPAGRLAAYPLPVACTFTELYQLGRAPGRAQYLLLGQEQLNAPSVLSQAYVVELKGNYLLLNNAAFGRAPLLPLCNTEMEFDENKQALRLDLTDYDPAQQGANPLAVWGYRTAPASKRLVLYFRQGRFVPGR